jgi:uncharacterized protein (TIGR03437 family)
MRIVIGQLAGLLLALAAHAQPPVYSEQSIVNAASGQTARFAPNSHISIYGSRFSGSPNLQVMLLRTPAQLLYVSESQLNVVLPPAVPARGLELFVLRDGVTGPRVRIDLLPEAPELYVAAGGFAAATHADGRALTEGDPARPGQIVVIYGTGFGLTRLGEASAQRPAVRADSTITPIDVWLDGQRIPAENVLYAGVSPTYAGLYQLNLRLPETILADPLLQIGVRQEPSSRTGVRLMVRPPENL